MKIFVVSYTTEIIEFNVDPQTTVETLKQRIQDREGFAPIHQRVYDALGRQMGVVS